MHAMHATARAEAHAAARALLPALVLLCFLAALFPADTQGTPAVSHPAATTVAETGFEEGSGGWGWEGAWGGAALLL